MNKNIYWPWAIKNIIDIACWTALAIHFNKWWIALFAVLFVSSLKTNVGRYRICDKCGKATRIGYKILGDGKKSRYCKNCLEILDD